MIVNMITIIIIMYSIRGILFNYLVRGLNKLLEFEGEKADAVLVELACVSAFGKKRDYVGYYTFKDSRGEKYTHEKILEGLPADIEELAEYTSDKVEVEVVYYEEDPSYSVLKHDLETYKINEVELALQTITIAIGIILLKVRIGG